MNIKNALGLVVIATAVLREAPAVADPSGAGVLTVRISDLRSNGGQVGCTIYRSPKGYPTDPTAALEKLWCPIASSVAACAFKPLPPGTYAVACFHDENGNGKLDTGAFGIPTEGTVASNDARGFMGPPSFDKAKFAFSGAATDMPLKMRY